MKGWHAPPAGSHSGVADYAETLGKALAPLDVPEIDVYHLGNNRLHESIYLQAVATPGVVVLHDAVLHHFLLGALSRAEYINEFVYNYGEWRRHLGEELWDERANSGVDPRYFEFPMLRRVAEQSRAVIVHNPGAASLARSHGAVDVHVVPHFFDPAGEPQTADAAEFRDDLGVSPGTVLFGIFGYLRETKRILPSIQAFRRLHTTRPATALLLAGEVVSPDLASLLNDEATGPAILRRGHLTEADLRRAAAAIDCCVNLRYPSAGETSGIAMRMMGAGKPVVLTAGEENSHIPAIACLRVTPGVAEAAELLDHMSLVTDFPGIARDIGAAARRHIRERHALEKVALQYRNILCAAASSLSRR